MDFDSSNDSDTAVVTILNECGEGYDTYSIHYTDFYTGYVAGTYLDEAAGWTIGNYIVYKNGEVIFTGNTQEETDTQQHLTRRYASIPAVDSGDRIDALLLSVDDGAGNESTLEIDLFGDYGCVYTGNLTNFNDCIDDGIEDFLTLE